MGETIANVGFWPDSNPGNPPTTRLKLRYHFGNKGIDTDYDVEPDAQALFNAGRLNKRATFDGIMAKYTWWPSISADKRDAAWASLRRPHQ